LLTVVASDKLYEELVGSGVEVIYDDRDTQPGAMLADADLIGVPTRVVISSKSLAAGGAEVKARTDSEATIVALDKLATEYK
jgi:prolyl-tRNA synthetase